MSLGSALLAHLAGQRASTERLLQVVLRQHVAIRARDVEEVLATMTEIQAEMERRGALERERRTLLAAAADRLGVAPHAVTLDAVCSLLDPVGAELARERSAELRGLLAEVGRRHQANVALMRQELSFLEHLIRLLGAEEHGGYAPPSAGAGRAPVHPRALPPHVLDLHA
jgi:hypothetical protein